MTTVVVLSVAFAAIAFLAPGLINVADRLRASDVEFDDFEIVSDDSTDIETRVRAVIQKIELEKRKPWYRTTATWFLAGGFASLIGLGFTAYETFSSEDPTCAGYLKEIDSILERSDAEAADAEYTRDGLLREFLGCGTPSEVLERISG